jgi:hypothetical protein
MSNQKSKSVYHSEKFQVASADNKKFWTIHLQANSSNFHFTIFLVVKAISSHLLARARFHFATLTYFSDHCAVALIISDVDTTHIPSTKASVNAKAAASFDIVGQASATARALLYTLFQHLFSSVNSSLIERSDHIHIC